jgi:hypothetical protein
MYDALIVLAPYCVVLYVLAKEDEDGVESCKQPNLSISMI